MCLSSTTLGCAGAPRAAVQEVRAADLGLANAGPRDPARLDVGQGADSSWPDRAGQVAVAVLVVTLTIGGIVLPLLLL